MAYYYIPSKWEINVFQCTHGIPSDFSIYFIQHIYNVPQYGPLFFASKNYWRLLLVMLWIPQKNHILYMYEPVSKNRLLGSYDQRGYCPEPFSWPWTAIFDQKWFQSFLGPKEVAQVLWSTWVHWHIENWSGTQSTTKFYQNYLKYKLWALSHHFWPKILNLAKNKLAILNLPNKGPQV